MRQTGVGGGRNCGLVIALGLGLAAGPARDSAADSISYSTDRSISYTVPLSSVTQPGLVPFFDPTPGSLEAVAITASGTVGEEIDPAALEVGQYSGTYRVTIIFTQGFRAPSQTRPKRPHSG
jgi:hypothetical protein